LLYLFEDFALDRERRELRRSGDLVAVEPQVFDLLEYLVRNCGRVVSKDDLIAAVWDGRIVSDVTIDTRVNAARRAIQDSGKDQRLIKTLPRKGIRFVGTVREERRTAEAGPPSIAAEEHSPVFALPDRPSIAVLPFTNMSGDPEQEYFADGIVEDLITALSHFRWLFVIARNSTFTYKGHAVDVARVGRELGVRYVLEGSVRRVADHVRITVQLIEADRATHIWAQRFDRPVADIFALQDEITDCIAGALDPEISASERDRARRKPPEHLGAWELYQRGMEHVLQHNREHFIEAQKFFRRAIELDPNFSAPHSGLAIVGFHQFSRMSRDDPAATVKEMFKEAAREVYKAAARAVELDPNDSQAHVALGLAYIQQDELAHATAEHEIALSLNPSSAFARWGFGQVLVRTDRFEEALEQCEAALRLSPRDPRTWRLSFLRASALYQLRRYEEAAKWAREATRHPTADSLWPSIYLAGALVQLGRTNEAAAAIDEMRRTRPNATVSSLLLWPNMRIRSQRSLDHILEGLRQAGLPE